MGLKHLVLWKESKPTKKIDPRYSSTLSNLSLHCAAGRSLNYVHFYGGVSFS